MFLKKVTAVSFHSSALLFLIAHQIIPTFGRQRTGSRTTIKEKENSCMFLQIQRNQLQTWSEFNAFDNPVQQWQDIMQVVTWLKGFPKRFLTSVYNGILKVQQFHKHNRLTTTQIKDSAIKYARIIESQSVRKSEWVKQIAQRIISKYPDPAFVLYIALWLLVHYLVAKFVEAKIREYNGRGMLDAISYRIAEQNKPYVLKLIKQKLFKNEKVMNQIALTIDKLPYSEKVHRQLEAALSRLITSEFIKLETSKLSIYGLKGHVLDSFGQKQLKKVVIHIINNRHIRRLLKQLIIQYLQGQAFEELVTTQLANLVEMAYTKKLLAELVQSTFNGVIKDPYTSYLFLEGVKDWLL